MNTLEKSQAIDKAITALTPYLRSLRELDSDTAVYHAFQQLLQAQADIARERDADMLARFREGQTK
jgi:hypothetical protein